jgi:hypothetical protein
LGTLPNQGAWEHNKEPEARLLTSPRVERGGAANQLLEDIKKRGKSWQELEKEREKEQI